MLEAMNSVGKHDKLKRFKFIVFDLSNVTEFDFDEYSLVMAAAQLEACFCANRRIKVAVVSGGAHGDIVAQLLGDLLKRPLHVFTSVSVALVWARSW